MALATLAHAAWPACPPPPSIFLFPTTTWKKHLGRPKFQNPHGPEIPARLFDSNFSC
jgi:hypothetical protein